MRYPTLVIAALILLGPILVIFLFADWLAPYDYRTQPLLKRLKPPSFLSGMPEHLLGTDELGAPAARSTSGMSCRTS